MFQICQLQRENDALRCQLPQQIFSESSEKVRVYIILIRYVCSVNDVIHSN